MTSQKFSIFKPPLSKILVAPLVTDIVTSKCSATILLEYKVLNHLKELTMKINCDMSKMHYFSNKFSKIASYDVISVTSS